MSESRQPPAGSGPRIGLLAGQALALGLTTAWITVSATAIFLDAFGPGALPVTYLGAAFAGATATTLLTRTLRSHALSAVAVRVLGVMVVLLVAAWVLLSVWDATWASFALLVLLPIVVPIGFVFIVGQAGMLLDVRVLKSSYPRVIAGFASGFFAGGLVGPLLLRVLDTTDLLLAAAFAATGFLTLVVITRTTFPDDLALVVVDEARDEQRPTFRSLISNRLVLLIMAFQMLSAVESQWLDFLVNDRASQRYTDTAELATFLSRFFAITYGVDILFLLLLAGLLLRRFGLRYGLTANPGVVLVLVASVITGTVIAGSGATIVFLLVVASRVSDLTLSDGAARASLSAAYQAVPTRERTAAQTLVEGLGVPVAIGFSGLVLLVMRATIGTGSLALPVLTSIVVSVWGVVAVLVYRGYKSSLLSNLRRRVLDPSELTVDETNGVEVIDRLLESEDDRDVLLGLDALADSPHPAMVARLVRVATGPRVRPRVAALDLLLRVDSARAHDAALSGLADQSAEVRAASLRAMSLVGSPSDVEVVTDLTADDDGDVVVAAYAALSRIADDDAHLRVAAAITTLAADADPAQRVLAGRILAECEPLVGREPLGALLEDPDLAVVGAALAAVGEADGALLERVAGRLEDPRTAGAAVDALVRGGDAALAVCDEGLAGRLALGARAQELLARVCRLHGGHEAVAVLLAHGDHPDREVGLAVMAALAALDLAAGEHDEEVITNLLNDEVEHAVRTLRFLEIVPTATALHLALQDELTLTRRRVLAGLAFRYGSERLERVAFQLGQQDSRTRALTLEWLEVTLTGSDKAAIALLEPQLTNEERLRALARGLPAPPLTLRDAVVDLVLDPAQQWRSPWLVACALLTAADMPEVDFDLLVQRISVEPRPGGSDDAGIVDETILGIQQRRSRSADVA